MIQAIRHYLIDWVKFRAFALCRGDIEGAL